MYNELEWTEKSTSSKAPQNLIFSSDHDKASHIQHLLIQRATGQSKAEDEKIYEELRADFVDRQDLKDLLPDFLRTKRSLAQFWQFK